jgi:hypothetical protein
MFYRPRFLTGPFCFSAPGTDLLKIEGTLFLIPAFAATRIAVASQSFHLCYQRASEERIFIMFSMFS